MTRTRRAAYGDPHRVVEHEHRVRAALAARSRRWRRVPASSTRQAVARTAVPPRRTRSPPIAAVGATVAVVPPPPAVTVSAPVAREPRTPRTTSAVVGRARPEDGHRHARPPRGQRASGSGERGEDGPVGVARDPPRMGGGRAGQPAAAAAGRSHLPWFGRIAGPLEPCHPVGGLSAPLYARCEQRTRRRRPGVVRLAARRGGPTGGASRRSGRGS